MAKKNGTLKVVGSESNQDQIQEQEVIQEVVESLNENDQVEAINPDDLKKQEESEKQQLEHELMIVMQVNQIRGLRVRVDGLAHIIKTTGGQSLEKINCHNNLMMIRSWFNESLEYLGQPPLNHILLRKIEDVQWDTDKSDPIKVQIKMQKENEPVQLIDANDIESLAHVKQDLSNVVNEVQILNVITSTIYETFIFQHLREAKFWIDQELFRLKDENKKYLYSQTEQGKRKLPARPEKQKPLIITPEFGRSRNISGGGIIIPNSDNNEANS